MKTEQINTRFQRVLADRIRHVAKQKGLDVSELLRTAVDEYVTREEMKMGIETNHEDDDDSSSSGRLVLTSDDLPVDFDVAVSLMDEDIRDELQMASSANANPWTEQQFFDEYCERHAEKFGVAFVVDLK